MPQSTTPSSFSGHVSHLSAGAHVVFAAFLGAVPALALGDGTLLFVEGDKERRVIAHPEATILVGASDSVRLVTGGDDGRVVATSADGEMREIADEKGKWIDALALRADGSVAWSAGKEVRARDPKGDIEKLHGAFKRARPRLCAERLSSRDRPLQRREPVVPESRGAARTA